MGSESLRRKVKVKAEIRASTLEEAGWERQEARSPEAGISFITGVRAEP